MRFTWNEIKRQKVLADHGVDFAKIEDVFGDPFAFEDIDDEHSTDEEVRFTIVGLTHEYGLIFAAFTEPNDFEIHLITARKAEPWMLSVYDKERSRG